MTYRQPDRPIRRGCSIIMLTTMSLLLVIVLVGWGVTNLKGTVPTRLLQPVPANVPPANGAEVALIDVNAPGRTSAKLTFWAEPIAEQTGISVAALNAYGNAQLIAAQSWPGCHLNWTTLAGLGYVETRHGTYNGKIFGSARIDENGNIIPPIVGVPLDGSPGFAEIKDTDGGALDGDTVYDRAVGPMQFIPTSWEKYGRDANGDGVVDPQNIDDAAAGAATLLCSNGRDLATADGWTEAIRSYNFSSSYVIKVRDAAAAYALNQPPV